MQSKELAEARERMLWHEMMSRRNIDNSEALQARLLLAEPDVLHSGRSGRCCVPHQKSFSWALYLCRSQNVALLLSSQMCSGGFSPVYKHPMAALE